MKHLGIDARLTKLALFALLSAALAYGQQYNSPAPQDMGVKASASNPLTAEKVALGKRLFFDTRLSEDGWISCASCHDPTHAFSDPRKLSVGMLGQRGKRHAPTLLGRGLGESQFWDGRVATLEEQVLQPILNPEEMGMTMETVLQRLHQDRVFRGLTQQSLADALASYVRTIRSEDSHLDHFLPACPAIISDLEL